MTKQATAYEPQVNDTLILKTVNNHWQESEKTVRIVKISKEGGEGVWIYATVDGMKTKKGEPYKVHMHFNEIDNRTLGKMISTTTDAWWSFQIVKIEHPLVYTVKRNKYPDEAAGEAVEIVTGYEPLIGWIKEVEGKLDGSTIIGVEYDGEDPKSFRGVTISARRHSGRWDEVWIAGASPERCWEAVGPILGKIDPQGWMDHMCSSSVDNFINDGGYLGEEV